jgi:hypothetical protein
VTIQYKWNFSKTEKPDRFINTIIRMLKSFSFNFFKNVNQEATYICIMFVDHAPYEIFLWSNSNDDNFIKSLCSTLFELYIVFEQ